MKRILFLNYEYPPLGGGAGNASFYILREFSKMQNLEIDFVTSSVDDNYHREEVGSNINIHRLPIGKNRKNLHFQSQKDLIVYAWKAYFFCKELIKKSEYDFSHSFFTLPCGFLSFLFRWKYKLPYIVSLRGADVPGYSDRFTLIYSTLKPLVRLVWKKARFVVANSQGLRNLALETRPSQEIETIYNGVDVNEFKPATRSLAPVSGAKLLKKFIITPGASRITARKGLKYLIEAVSMLSSRYPNIKLKIMGEGDEKKNLENLVSGLELENKIKFLGYIPREEVWKYYQEADVFVLPSFNEGMSNAMLAAVASGLPIISTKTGGSEELLKGGENGYYIKMKDSENIAEKIEMLIKNDELRKKMSESSRKIAEKFSWSKVAEDYIKLYEEVKR